MVFRTFARFSKFSRSCYNMRKASFSSRACSQPFFYPSYRRASDLTPLDEVAHRRQSRNKTNSSGFYNVVPALTVTKNYVIFDPSLNRRKKDKDEERERDVAKVSENVRRIMLRRVNHTGSKNSHVTLKVEHMNHSHTALSIRRSNSNAIKRLIVATDSILAHFQQIQLAQLQQRRGYATEVASVNDLEHQLAKLKLDSAKKQEVKVELEELREPEVSAGVETVPNRVKFENSKTEPVSPSTISQEQVIDNMLSLGQNNEVLAVYFRMRGSNILPSIDVYNKILKSIQLRETDETSEQKLTHLLNVYSDMLSNNLKPSDKTYELVIEPLLKGSVHSYKFGDFKEGGDFLKIAVELFLISHNSNTTMKFKNSAIYNELLYCLNCYQMVNSASPQTLYSIMKERIQETNGKLEFYLQLIRFSALSRDYKFVETLYSEMKSLNPSVLEENQYTIYCSVIEALNFCGEVQRSSSMMDKVIGEMEDKTSKVSQSNISHLLSGYIKSQSWMNPYDAYKTLERLNSIAWLPDVSVASLCNLYTCFLNANDLPMAIKVWNFAVIREDFDRSVESLSDSADNNFIQLSDSLNHYVELLLTKGDKNLLLKTAREIIVKKSLILADRTLVQLLAYLQNEGYYDLAIKFIIDQGVKRDLKHSTSLNNYLSLVVDFVSPKQIAALSATKFFKRTVEQYRLMTDNVYGLIKVFNSVLRNLSNEKLKLRLAYYAKVLSCEFDDVTNFYVTLPDELREFKSQLLKVQEQLKI
ncbi:DEKNAAC100132 [Brettanomyces naardenensis]|uniref:DEKNAAC100132 n=1 Tax=Brettanomyces naardenensis TaxID=13370 RepID=A0A448YEV7_BRENA|nr:DEKNAAC100132 [Brettanomyces naardenensis]